MPKTKIINSAGITAAIGLAALPVFLTLSPMFGSLDVNAEVTETLGASATINSTLGLSANSIDLVINPTSNGTVFKTGQTIATVSTNNETGYTLYLSDSDSDNALKHKNLADKAIVSTETSVTGESMLPNTWGYTLGNSEVEQAEETNNETNLSLNYSPIPIERTVINKKEAAISTDHTPITFGIKVNTDIPSGTYSDEVSITAVANYNSTAYPDDTLWLDKNGNRITTMQQMTGDICANVPTPLASAGNSGIPTITLTDTRDSKTYTVKKLADGNCWMTSDLAIEDYTLTAANSNVITSFDLPAATSTSGTSNSYDAAMVANDGWDQADLSTNVAEDTDKKTTYLYNWYAATAGSGTESVTSDDVSQDICPKGWHLPSKEGNGSWDKLLRRGQGVYEIATADHGYSETGWGFYNNVKNSDDNPLGLHITGNFNGGSLRSTSNGNYWSRTAKSDTDAYSLAFGDNYGNKYIYPQGYSSKQLGFAVRCVADVTTPADVTYMQEVTACPASLPKEKWYTLKDKRDNKEYTVARLADGNCWMTSDLAIEDYKLTPADSNVIEKVTLPAADTYANLRPATYTAAQIANNGVGGAYLYNWFAAIAAIPGTNLETDAAYGANETAPQDICPKGWHLPDNSGSTSWGRLLDRTGGAYKDITFVNLASGDNVLGLHTTGDFDGSGFLRNTGIGYYWSRTAGPGAAAYNLYSSSSDVNPQNFNGRYYGFAVRCVHGS